MDNAWLSDVGTYTVVVSNLLGILMSAPVMLAVIAPPSGAVVAWGRNAHGQTTVPAAAQSGVASITAGEYHTAVAKADGSVVAWGLNDTGQTIIPVEAQSGVVAVAAGELHSS
jgi:alpha-tubulin suppressor-like RCC1 family protein